MKTSRIVLSFVASAAFSLALVGEASAGGACVYVKNESFQCVDRVSNPSACKQKAPGGLGEFHSDTTCKNIGHGVTWGIAKAPPPPAKPASFTMKAPADLPPIPSPLQKKSQERKIRF